MTLRPALAALALAILSASPPTPAPAQQPARRVEPQKRPEAAKGDAKPAEAVSEEPAPQYEPQMLRLAETLGALTFLRDLCGAGDGAQWRERMTNLLDSEGRDEARRARLAGAFNRGFQDYAAIYLVCTPNAELALARRLAEGQKLTRDLATRWGG